MKNLYDLIPHMGWEKIEMLKADVLGDYAKGYPLVYHEITGRASVKSVGNAEIILLRLILACKKMHEDPLAKGLDILCMTWEQKAISHTVVANLKEAVNYLGIDQSLVNFHIPATAEKYIDVTWNNKVCRIWFAHGQNGYNSIKGYEPLTGNKWWCLWLYELDQFSTWIPGDVEMAISTLARSADAGFHVLIEQNQPRPGSGGVWTLDYEAKQDKAELNRQQALKMFPNDPQFKHRAYIKKRYHVLDMWPVEFNKFVTPKMKAAMTNLAFADRDTFDWVYKGKEIASDGAVFRSLNRRVHFGMHENMKYDYLCVGVDLGNLDSCCAILRGIQFPTNEKQLKIQDGLAVVWHSNRWREVYVPDPTIVGQCVPRFHKDKSVHEWIQTDLCEFLDLIARRYPYQQIHIQIEYADANSPKYLRYLANRYVGSFFRFAENWCKDSIHDCVLVNQLMFSTIKQSEGDIVYKCANEQLWESLTSLRWCGNGHEDEDKPRKVLDDTSKREAKFFDLFDSSNYCFSQSVRNTIKEYFISNL